MPALGRRTGIALRARPRGARLTIWATKHSGPDVVPIHPELFGVHRDVVGAGGPGGVSFFSTRITVCRTYRKHYNN